MWKEIRISQQSYLINCDFGEDNKVTFTLYDHQKETWWEVLTIDELKRKVKVLNRRYEYNEEIIRKTLSDGDLESATMEKEKSVLKLKYRVMSCPFHYEWNLIKPSLLDLQATFMKPLFTALMGCQEQIEILMENLKKKDAEILQYRKEGAILNRKTLATKLFDFEAFSGKYESRNKLVADFKELGKFIVNAEPGKVLKAAPASPQRKVEKQEDVETKTGEKLTPCSPGQKKRKILKQKQLMETTLKARRNVFEYESSQSQALSSSSQSTEESIPSEANVESKDPPQKPATIGQGIRARRTSQCTPMKEKAAKKTNDHKSHAESSESRKDSRCAPKKDNDGKNFNDHKSHSESDESVFNTPRKRSIKILSSPSQSQDTGVKDKNKQSTQKKEASSKDAMDQSGNSHKTTSHSLDRNNCKNDDVTSASPRKENQQIGNTQAQDVASKSANINKVDKNIERADNMEQQDKKQIRFIDVSDSEGDEIISTTPRKRRRKSFNRHPEDNSQKSSVDGDDMSNEENSKKKEASNTKKQPSTHYLDISIPKIDEVIIKSPRKEIAKKLNMESLDNRTKFASSNDTENTTKKEASSGDDKERRNSNIKPSQFLDICDSESDEHNETTPQKRKSPSLNGKTPRDTSSKPASIDDINKDNKNTKYKEASSRADTQKDDIDEAFDYVVEISTDSECNEPATTPKRGRRKRIIPQPESPSFPMKSRITRSTPLVLSAPKLCHDPRKSGRRTSLQLVMSDMPFIKAFDNSDSDTNNKPTAVGEISSQLEVIRKELKSLEALRLADLKHRTCKA